jgi:hypothetical protein
MFTRRSFAIAAACIALIAPACAGDASATVFVTAIYHSYIGKGAKGVPLDSERKIRRYFEPGLATLMVRDQTAAARRKEVGSLDFDPFINAQDWEIASFDIAVGDAVAGKAQATVKFVNLGTAKTVLLDLVQVKGAWRISDITWQEAGRTDTLRKIFVH